MKNLAVMVIISIGLIPFLAYFFDLKIKDGGNIMKTRKVYVSILIVIWIVTFSIIFGKMAMAADCTGNLPIC